MTNKLKIGEAHINFFKPLLTPNWGVGVEPNWEEVISEPRDWLVSIKYDGVRAEVFSDNKVLSRELKVLPSVHVQAMGEEFKKINPSFRGTIEAELYGAGLTRPEIIHFVKTEDVTSNHTKEKYRKLWVKTGGNVAKGWKFPGRSVEFLTTWPSELKMYVFDAWFYNHRDLTKEQRYRLLVEKGSVLVMPDDFYVVPQSNHTSLEDIYRMYTDTIGSGGEGLMLVRRDAPYKYGRFTIKQAYAFKMKDDNREYEGTITGVYETTIAKEGTEKTINPLGRSKTSQKQEDRELSGMAGGFNIRLDDGKSLKVGLKGYDHTQRKALLYDGSKVLGQRIKFLAMKPVKEGGVPSQAYYTKS